MSACTRRTTRGWKRFRSEAWMRVVVPRAMIFFVGDMSLSDSRSDWLLVWLLKDAPSFFGESAPAEAAVSGATRLAWPCMAKPSR